MTDDARKAWRAIARHVSTAGLKALAEALAEDSDRLIQGATTAPPTLTSCLDWPLDCCCVVAYAALDGNLAVTVGEADTAFAALCSAADRELGEPAGVRFALNWIDETPRDEMRRELLPEVLAVLSQRELAA